MLYTVAFPRRRADDPQRAHQDAGPQGPDDRRLLARGRADLLAVFPRSGGVFVLWPCWERRRKLKPEYQGLAGEQIRDLRLGGTDVTAEVRIPRVAYLGDSAPQGLDDCPAMYEAQVLILELTFVAPSHKKEKIHKFGHIHLDDLVERQGRFQNELV